MSTMWNSQRHNTYTHRAHHATTTDDNKWGQLTDMTIFFNPKSLCSGHIAMSPIAVVQFGLAINFFPFVVSELISGTTRGIPSL